MFGFLMSCLRGTRDVPGSKLLPQASREIAAARFRMVDVDGMIRQASTRVSVDQLIRNGKKYIQVLSREKIDELINRAVKTIVDKHRATSIHQNAASAARIAADSRAEFEELLLQVQQTADATRAVEESKQSLEEARVEPAPEKARVAQPAPPRGFEDVVRELDRQVVQAFDARRSILDRPESAEAVAELDRVQDVFRAALSKVVDAERGRLAASDVDPREIATLKKRVEKLLAHIATMEAALKTLSTAKTFSNQQVQNLLRNLGLVQEDRYFERKKEMLKVVLDANQGIRKAARALAARGITLDAPEEKAVFTCVGEIEPGVFTRSSV